MKKVLLIIISVIFIFLLCNLNKQTTKEEIKFSSWGSQSEVQILTKLIKDFEEECQINVEFIHIPENYFQKLQLLFASNLEPDVVFINNQNIKMYIDANLLEDLTPYFKEEINEYYKSAIDSFKVEEKIYAVPRDVSNLVLYVNKDILEENKILYKTKITTLDELTEILNNLTNKENFGINYEDNPLFWSYFLASNGGGILSDDGKDVIITQKESIDAINLYKDYINRYHIAPTKAEIGSMTTAQMFINGELAMYLGGRWMVPKFRETIDFNWDIIEFPSSENKKVYVDSSGWAISKKSKNKANAIKFIKYLASDKASQELALSGLIIPAKIKIAEDFIQKDAIKRPEHSKIFIEMLKYTKPTPTNKNHSRINDILKDKSQLIFNSNKDAQSVIDKKTVEKIKGLT